MISLIKNYLQLVLIALVLVFVTACGDDDANIEPASRIALSVSATNLESGRGTSVEVPITIMAEEGIQSLTVAVDGGATEIISTTAGQTAINATYSYTIPADALFNSAAELVFEA